MSARRVLIVDDDDFVREVAQTSLEIVAGWEVLTAVDGEEAVRIARAERPDVIILDVMMPGMDGPETLERLRAHEETVATPVVFMTAKVVHGEVERLGSLDVEGVVTKPFDPLELHETVSRILGW